MNLRLLRFFDVKENEQGLVFLLIVHSFFVGIPRSLGSTVATTLFDPQYLPQALIFSALLNVFIALGFNFLQSRLSFSLLSYLNLGIQLISLVAFAAAFFLLGTTDTVLGIVFFVWVQVVMVLSYKEFWDLAGRLLDIRQSKRLFALIGAGEILFIIPAGFLGSYLTLLGMPMLLVIAALGVLGSVFALRKIQTEFRHLLSRTRRGRREKLRKEKHEKFQLTPYIALIFALAIIYVMGFALINQLYLDALRGEFPLAEMASEKSAFILIILAATGALQLVIRLFGADNFIAKFGVAGGLLILPMLALISGGILVGDYLLGLGSIFAVTVLVRGIYYVLKPSVDRPAAQILIQVFPEGLRQRLNTIRDGIVEPIATGATGLLLLVLVPIGLDSRLQAIFFVMIVLAWLVIALLTLRRYSRHVLEVLQQRQANIFSELFQDGRNLERIKRGLGSIKPLEVLYSMRVLDTLSDDSLKSSFKNLLQHPNEMVRRETLALIEKYHQSDLLADVALLCERDPDAEVRAAAVRTMGSLGADEAYEDLMGYLISSEREIRGNAIVGLLRGGDIEGVIHAGNILLTMSQSSEVSERLAAATVLGEIGNRNFYRLLPMFLDDEDIAVRNAALISAGKVNNPKLWNLIIPSLNQSRTRSSAIVALSGADSSILAEFDKLFHDENTSPKVLSAVARICSRINGEEAIQFLLKHSRSNNLNVRLSVLQSLADLGYQADSNDERHHVMAYVRDEVSFVAWCLGAVKILNPYPSAEIVVNSLNIEIEQAKARIFYWLSFLHDSDVILSAKEQMARASSNAWALILEALEQILDAELRSIIFPIFERISPEEQHRRLGHFFPYDETVDAIYYLEYIIAAKGLWIEPWLRATAMYAAPEVGGIALAEAVYAVVREESGMVKETALWSLSRISPQLYQYYSLTRRKETSELPKETIGVVRDTQGHMRKVKSGGETMLLTIEKVLVLKQVGIFSSTSEEFLADLASLMEEVRVAAGEVVIEEKSEPSYLYVVLEGALLVKSRDHVLAELGENDIFGEMSFFLDEKEHSATVIARVESQLLRLHKDDFMEMLYDYPQISRGIIRELASRLRQSNAKIVDLESR